MHRDDLLSHVRTRARLHGRGHAQQVVEAVVQGLRGVVPEAAFLGLTAQLPFALGVAPPREEPVGPGACRALIREVARRLNVAEPDAAFYARVTFEQLNAFCHGVSPARIASAAPAELRPLLSARAEDSAHRSRRRLATLGAPVSSLALRAQIATPRTMIVRADSKRAAPAERR